ncbi:sulfite exporter TauE/SafE family protein [Desulfurivibrio sp. C05AmB]|uniref:sulfite exporter TauE/SafE family protein n=1 Tax=Desulfurivibrio sp. C05AmB TaxID=3374371 RepID=UPI00376EE184
MVELSMEALILVLAAVALAAFIHGALGIGFPMVVTPLLSLVTDVQTAIMSSLLPNIALNLISIYRGGQWGESVGRYWPLALFLLSGSVVGTVILVNSNPNHFRLLLALAIFFYLYTALRPNPLSWSFFRTHPRSSIAGTGLLAGMLGGTVNVSGPILLIYLLELSLPPLAMVQIINLCFLAGKVAQLTTFSALGEFNRQFLLISLPLLALSVIFLLWGMRLRERLPVATYRRWLHRLLAVVAFLLIGQFVMGLA